MPPKKRTEVEIIRSQASDPSRQAYHVHYDVKASNRVLHTKRPSPSQVGRSLKYFQSFMESSEHSGTHILKRKISGEDSLFLFHCVEVFVDLLCGSRPERGGQHSTEIGCKDTLDSILRTVPPDLSIWEEIEYLINRDLTVQAEYLFYELWAAARYRLHGGPTVQWGKWWLMDSLPRENSNPHTVTKVDDSKAVESESDPEEAEELRLALYLSQKEAEKQKESGKRESGSKHKGDEAHKRMRWQCSHWTDNI
ncbi:hypothetical protein PROFUN_10849 [Planoprotostelium fungivorum]|uniref:Uncharacterized protein n=1 Tax=Planoprotostelium fungivorum TaxID=1890364 RepID=A0A2P6NCR2_9EUKA|nr:hypothetical protein PROFUN_10849 [Planoprotostelium fungivorum]